MGIIPAMSPQLLSHFDLDRCPHCNIDKPNLREFGEWSHYQSASHDRRIHYWWKAYKCARCGGVLVARYSGNSQISFKHTLTAGEYFPQQPTLSDELPERATFYLKQALDTVSSPSASIVMSAASVDAMLKHKDLTEGSLYARIEQAIENHIITPEMAEWAHDIRLDANDERHADEDAADPTAQDAQRCIDFAKALADYLFVLPARVKRGIRTEPTPDT